MTFVILVFGSLRQCGAKILSRGPVLLHMTSKKFHLEQNSFSCRAIFLHKAWTNLHVEIAPHENIISTDNVRGDRDKYNVWIHHPHHPHHPHLYPYPHPHHHILLGAD